MEKRYILYVLYAIIGIVANFYSIQQEGSILLISASVVAGLILVLSSEMFARSFDYPLFFVRDKLNYWGGAFGGATTMFFYIIGYVAFDPVGMANIGSLMYLIFSGFGLVIVLYTGTILRDVEMGYVDG